MTLFLIVALSVCQAEPSAPSDAEVAACLAKVSEIHGAAGPWAVVGYRIGKRGLQELGLEKHSHDLRVSHYCPQVIQFSCMADGVQAATGASLGKLNLRLVEVEAKDLRTEFTNQETKQTVTIRIKPDLAHSITDLPFEKFEEASKRIAKLPDEAVFEIEKK